MEDAGRLFNAQLNEEYYVWYWANWPGLWRI